MTFKIYSNNFSEKQIKVNLDQLEEGVHFAKEHRCDGLNLASAVGENVTADLSLLKTLSSGLKFLSIDTYVKLNEQKNSEAIYDLKNLEKLVVGKQAYKIDYSRFNKLFQLGLDYTKSSLNVGDIANLSILVISYYSETDLLMFSKLQKLDTLHIYQSKIETAKAIGKLKNLVELNFTSNKSLQNIDEINILPDLKKLHIEKCPKLADFQFLSKNKSITDLTISEVPSLKFVEGMHALEKINFWNLKDGDLSPLLRAPKLRDVSFYPEKKQYSHSKKQINDLLAARKFG